MAYSYNRRPRAPFRYNNTLPSKGNDDDDQSPKLLQQMVDAFHIGEITKYPSPTRREYTHGMRNEDSDDETTLFDREWSDSESDVAQDCIIKDSPTIIKQQKPREIPKFPYVLRRLTPNEPQNVQVPDASGKQNQLSIPKKHVLVNSSTQTNVEEVNNTYARTKSQSRKYPFRSDENRRDKGGPRRSQTTIPKLRFSPGAKVLYRPDRRASSFSTRTSQERMRRVPPRFQGQHDHRNRGYRKLYKPEPYTNASSRSRRQKESEKDDYSDFISQNTESVGTCSHPNNAEDEDEYKVTEYGAFLFTKDGNENSDDDGIAIGATAENFFTCKMQNMEELEKDKEALKGQYKSPKEEYTRTKVTKKATASAIEAKENNPVNHGHKLNLGPVELTEELRAQLHPVEELVPTKLNQKASDEQNSEVDLTEWQSGDSINWGNCVERLRWTGYGHQWLQDPLPYLPPGWMIPCTSRPGGMSPNLLLPQPIIQMSVVQPNHGYQPMSQPALRPSPGYQPVPQPVLQPDPGCQPVTQLDLPLVSCQLLQPGTCQLPQPQAARSSYSGDKIIPMEALETVMRGEVLSLEERQTILIKHHSAALRLRRLGLANELYHLGKVLFGVDWVDRTLLRKSGPSTRTALVSIHSSD